MSRTTTIAGLHHQLSGILARLDHPGFKQKFYPALLPSLLMKEESVEDEVKEDEKVSVDGDAEETSCE